MTIETISIQDFDTLIGLWQTDPNIGLNTSDEKEHISSFIEKNPGFSFKIVIDGKIIGAVLCGHDGRRGYMYHLFVHPDFRKKGYGKLMVNTCISRLAEAGIHKCHVHVFANNVKGQKFWAETGFRKRDDLVTFTRETG